MTLSASGHWHPGRPRLSLSGSDSTHPPTPAGQVLSLGAQAEPTGTRPGKHHISTEELEAKLGIHDIRHLVCSFEGADVHTEILRARLSYMDADRAQSLLQRYRPGVVARPDGKQASGKTKVLQVTIPLCQRLCTGWQKLLDEVRLGRGP